MTRRNENMRKFKGFTLVEMIIVVAIIGALSLIIIPTLSGFIKDAKRKAAITDAHTIKNAIECTLVEQLPKHDDVNSAAFNKVLYFDTNKGKKMSERDYEDVGAFSNVSWVIYKNNSNGGGGSQAVDKLIAGALENVVGDSFKAGNKKNPMSYNTDTNNCAKYVKDNKTNFGLIVVYDTSGFVQMMQLYRKGVLVTYVNNQYLVNTSPKAHFVGEGTWDKIFADSDNGGDCPEEYGRIYLANTQRRDSGGYGGWY